MSLQIETIINGMYMENCYLVWCDETKKGIFIDPGDEAERLIGIAESKGVEVEAIYNTHGHFDHTGAVLQIQSKLKIPFVIHSEDKELAGAGPLQAQLFGLVSFKAPKVDKTVEDGDVFKVGNHEARVIHTPGHSKGGACFLFEGVIFVGDTLFAGSIGRSDLPGGSHKILIKSINERLMTLDDSIRVLTGHGEETNIGTEKRSNPFIDGSVW